MNIKHWGLALGVTLLTAFGIGACADEFENSPDKCLPTNGRQCDNNGTAPTTDGGGTTPWTCANDPNYMKDCGNGGKYVCDPNGALVCSAGPWTCDTDPNLGKPCPGGTYQCNTGGHLVCMPSGSSDSGTGGHDSGTGGDSGGTYNCRTDSRFGTPCPGGTYVCNSTGTDVVCSSSGGGDGGTGGSDGGSGGTGGDGGSSYNCSTDPALGTHCGPGNIGTFKCRPDGTGLTCDTSGSGGDGGTGGDSGSGSGGGDGGTGGFPGSVGCTTATTIALTLTLSSGTLLHSVMSDGTGFDSSLSQLKVLTNNQRLIVAVQGNLTSSVNVGQINVFKAFPDVLFDIKICDLMGLTGPACTTMAIGDRTAASYLTNVGKVEQCRVHGICDPLLGGLVPATSFTLYGVLGGGSSLPALPSGNVELAFDVPPLCP
jgi:hypothetical protein